MRVVLRIVTAPDTPGDERTTVAICQAPMFQNVRRADDRRRTRGYTGVALNPQHGADLPSPVVPPKSAAPSTSAVRRVLRRARDGVALNIDEAAIALTARGDDLAD